METIRSLIKKPGAWLPMAISFASLIFLIGYVIVSGIEYHEEERAPARIFQLLMLAQLPVIALFALRWIPRAPKQAFVILLFQVIAAVVPVVTVILLEQ